MRIGQTGGKKKRFAESEPSKAFVWAMTSFKLGIAKFESSIDSAGIKDECSDDLVKELGDDNSKPPHDEKPLELSPPSDKDEAVLTVGDKVRTIAAKRKDCYHNKLGEVVVVLSKKIRVKLLEGLERTEIKDFGRDKVKALDQGDQPDGSKPKTDNTESKPAGGLASLLAGADSLL